MLGISHLGFLPDSMGDIAIKRSSDMLCHIYEHTVNNEVEKGTGVISGPFPAPFSRVLSEKGPYPF